MKEKIKAFLLDIAKEFMSLRDEGITFEFVYENGYVFPSHIKAILNKQYGKNNLAGMFYTTVPVDGLQTNDSGTHIYENKRGELDVYSNTCWSEEMTKKYMEDVSNIVSQLKSIQARLYEFKKENEL